jgi:hypothetical protein
MNIRPGGWGYLALQYRDSIRRISDKWAAFQSVSLAETSVATSVKARAEKL